MEILYIIGFRYANCYNRLQNLLVVLNWLSEFKNIKVLVVEQDDTPKLIGLLPPTILYRFLVNCNMYNRGWAFNVGVKTMKNMNYYFFGDADIILKSRNMQHVFETCHKYEAVNPYSHIYDTSEGFCKKSHQSYEFREGTERKGTCFSGGIVGLSSRLVHVLGGWDENFRGRGYEDYAFTAKIKLFAWSTHTYDFDALHLWHPWETNTSRENNYKWHCKYAKWTFCDFMKHTGWCDFGRTDKYCLTKSCASKCRKHMSCKRKNRAECKFKKWKCKHKCVYYHIGECECDPAGESGGAPLNADVIVTQSGGVPLNADVIVTQSGGVPLNADVIVTQSGSAPLNADVIVTQSYTL